MMKKYIYMMVLCAITAQVKAQNTNENSPNKGQDPCARPQIETNPFNPKNTEWYSMRNRFNWMDYVTWHNRVKKN